MLNCYGYVSLGCAGRGNMVGLGLVTVGGEAGGLCRRCRMSLCLDHAATFLWLLTRETINEHLDKDHCLTYRP